MIRKIISMVLISGFLIPLFCQNMDELLDQVDLKLRKDKKYLNIHYITFPNNKIGESLKNIPRTNYREPVSFKVADNIAYNVIFLKDAIGLDSITILYVDEITDKSQGEGAGMFSAAGGPQSDTIKILTFKDLYSLHISNSATYKILYDEINRYVRENPDQPPSSLLKIQPDNDIKTSLGIASRDNTDYLNYARANNIHWYPKPKVEKKGKRGAQPTEVDSVEYRIDAGLTSISFSHRSMDFSIGGASLELGVEEKLLNLLPYSQMSVNGGFRTLVNIADKKEDITKALIIDARFLGRVPMDMKKLPTSLPFMGAGEPKLMVGTGAGFDVSVTRPFGMPFLNLFVMTGAEPSLSNPPIKFTVPNGPGKSKVVTYYNVTSLEGSMSFYWNTSETMLSRFRVDVGVGYYDIWEAEYANMAAKKQKSKKQMQNDFSPMVAMHFNFAPNGVDIYNAVFKIFDNQVKVSGWLKLMEIEEGHVLRIGGTYITPPIGRGKRNWETDGGAVVQVRYRYGF